MRGILALDLGTTTGVAHHSRRTRRVWGRSISWTESADEVKTWKKQRLTRRGDPRIGRFYDWLKHFIHKESKFLSHLVFEDVEFCSHTYQCQLWASFRTVVWIVAREEGLQVEAVPVKSLKLWATGNGGASKKGMMNALVKTSPTRFALADTLRKTNRWKVRDTLTNELLDDNAVDALWLYSWGLENCII